MSKKISIVVPSYNESLDLKKSAVLDIENYLKSQSFDAEVLIVDDASTNETLEPLKEFIRGKKGFKVIENEHGGKAITVMSGMLKASGEIRVFTDMDQATPITELNKLLEKFEEGFDIVIGSRKGRKGAPLTRKIAAFGFATLRNIILGLPYKDTQCGFKGFTKGATEAIFPDLLAFWKKMAHKGAAVNAGFDVETLFIAKKRNLKTIEVEVEWRHVQNEKQVQIVKDSMEALVDMVRIRLNDWSGKYS